MTDCRRDVPLLSEVTDTVLGLESDCHSDRLVSSTAAGACHAATAAAANADADADAGREVNTTKLNANRVAPIQRGYLHLRINYLWTAESIPCPINISTIRPKPANDANTVAHRFRKSEQPTLRRERRTDCIHGFDA